MAFNVSLRVAFTASLLDDLLERKEKESRAEPQDTVTLRSQGEEEKPAVATKEQLSRRRRTWRTWHPGTHSSSAFTEKEIMSGAAESAQKC